MFSHLKAEDFVNLMEGAAVPTKMRQHIESCPRCRATWEATRSVHNEITSFETDIPEPDWDQFRSSVRDQLLSRSIQRQSAVRRWTGWSIRPVAAWALSLFLAVGVTTFTVLWKVDRRPVATTETTASTPAEPTVEVLEVGLEKSLFDDVVSLGEEQQEQLRLKLEAAQ